MYAVDYNPKNDLHLNRAVLADMKSVRTPSRAPTPSSHFSCAFSRRPTVLITDAYNVTTEPFRAAKENDVSTSTGRGPFPFACAAPLCVLSVD